MSKNKNTFRNFLLFSVILVTLLTFLNQFYISENNQRLNQELILLTEKTKTIEKNNTELKQSIEKNQEIIENILKEKSLSAKQPVSTLAIRNLENGIDNIKIASFTDADTSDLPKIKDETFVPNSENNLAPQNRKLINILALGKNGGLTDTIMIISIDKEKKNINLISIPRDYWDSKYKSKINSLYKKYGLEKLKESIARLTLLKVDRVIELDFAGFEKIIDHLGGIWIYNEKKLYDRAYPTSNYKYEVFSLEQGYQKLDGKTALKFARTRHSDSDYKRAGRQQEVINGILNALRKLDYTDIGKIINIIKEIFIYTKTDLSIFECLEYLSDSKEFNLKGGNVLNVPEHLTPGHSSKGEYIALPKDPSLKQIHTYIASLIN